MTNSIIYTKIFSSFTEGIKELIDTVPMARNYLEIGSDGKARPVETEEEALACILSHFENNKPVTSNPNYPYTYSLSSNAFSTTFRTDKRLSFGWKIKLMEDGKPSYSFKVSFPNASTKSTCEYKLTEIGWKMFEYTNRKYVKNNQQVNKE